MKDKFIKALELQEQGISRNEIYKIIGYSSLDTLTKCMRKNGYRYDKKEEKYIKVECNTTSNTSSITSNEVSTVICNELSLNKEQVRVLDVLGAETQTLLDMLSWYKQQIGNTSNTNSNTSLMTIKLPKSENIIVSSRVNSEVWKQFKNFTKKHNDFNVCDLLSQALIEFMSKYEDEI